ncbi:MAG TPA: hypothetical protein VNQ79_28305 [Blastocatellia bacterium]|nr:hypothetical protein [Blastocatellia bacterium]
MRGALRESVGGVERVLRDPQPDVLVTGFETDSVRVRIRCWTEARRGNISEVQDRVITAVRRRLNQLKGKTSEAAPPPQGRMVQNAG